MSEAKRTFGRCREANTEVTLGAAAAIIAVLLAIELELNGPQRFVITQAVFQWNDFCHRGKLHSSFAQALQFLAENMPGELAWGGVVLGAVTFAATAFGITGGHEGRNRDPVRRLREQGSGEVPLCSQTDKKKPERIAFTESDLAEPVERLDLVQGEALLSNNVDVINMAITIFVRREKEGVLVSAQGLAVEVFADQ